MTSAKELIRAYLEDAIAAERTFETQMREFAKEGDDETAKALFLRHADETRVQYDRLRGRLNVLGGSVSGVKTALAHIFGLLPKTAQLGHFKEERTAQNLMIAYTVECSETAMYESLATIARSAGDTETEELARSIQQEERETAEKIWQHLPIAARIAFNRVVGENGEYRRAS